MGGWEAPCSRLTHRLVRSNGFQVFRSILSPEGEEGEVREGGEGGAARGGRSPVSSVRIANLGADAFEAVLRFLYEGECTLPSPRLLPPILDASARLKISPLQVISKQGASARSTLLLPCSP